jgi:hypothetical protein
MQTFKTLFCIAALSCNSLAVELQPEASLSAFMTSDKTHAGRQTLWIAVKNTTARPAMFCRRGVEYTLVSFDPARPSHGVSKDDPGCGTDGFDPWWLLLPGETRLDSLQLDAPADLTAAMRVGVDLLVRTGLREMPRPITLSWSGSVSAALEAGAAVVPPGD